jgi:NAD-dependent SIR2 family protein deacetylase
MFDRAPDALTPLVSLLAGRRISVLTGAGCSTESGIPDYRGEGTRARARTPIQHRAFLEDAATRERYWARAVVGWERFSRAQPNPAHHALAALEQAGLVCGVITQNVDRLHHAAGSRCVVELHGALAEVRCLACAAREDRGALQARLRALNPGFDPADIALAPDGDAELDGDAVRAFRVAACLACGGVLKPDVVFFGDNVARPVVDAAFALLEEGEVLLVVGTSLAVFSGFRFVRRAAERGQPVAIVNLAETRGDPHATVRVSLAAGTVLPALAAALLGRKHGPHPTTDEP